MFQPEFLAQCEAHYTRQVRKMRLANLLDVVGFLLVVLGFGSGIASVVSAMLILATQGPVSADYWIPTALLCGAFVPAFVGYAFENEAEMLRRKK